MSRARASSRFQSVPISIALIIGAQVSLMCGASLAKILFAAGGPEGVTVVRTGLGALMLFVLWRPWRFRLGGTQIRAIAAYGVCLGLMNLLFYFAIQRLPLGLAVALEFLGPLAVAILYSRKPIDLFWVALVAIGIFLILPIRQSVDRLDPIGIAFALAAAAAWGIYIVVGKRAGRLAPSGAVTSIGLIFSALVTLPFGATKAVVLFSHSEFFWRACGVGLLSSALPYSLEINALKNLPEKHFGLLMSLEPAIAALAGFVILGERLTPVQMVAVLCVIAASVGSTVTGRAPHPEAVG